MENEIKKASSKGQEVLEENSHFKGYTLEELRYQRAMTTLQKELCKSRVLKDIDRIKKGGLSGGASKGSKIGLAGTVASTLLRGLNYLDYITLGLSIFGTGKKLLSFLPRKKK